MIDSRATLISEMQEELFLKQGKGWFRVVSGIWMGARWQIKGRGKRGKKVVDTADFDTDNDPDILWRHSITGQNVIWVMDGTSLDSYAWLNTVADANWKIIAAVNFDTDNDPDILWRHSTTGQNVIWVMDGTTLDSYAWLDTVADINWKIADVGNFDADTDPDILWRHSTNGQNVI